MQMKIAHKLVAGFGIVIALSVAIGWFGLSRLAAVSTLNATVAARDFETMDKLHRITAGQDQMAIERERTLGAEFLRSIGETGISPDDAQAAWSRARDETRQHLLGLRENASAYTVTYISAERKQRWERMVDVADEALATLARLEQEVEQQFALQNRGDLQAFAGRLDHLGDLRHEFDVQIDAAATLIREMVAFGQEASAAAYSGARQSIMIALLAIIAFSAGCSWFIQRSITRPLNAFIVFAEQVGSGDLTQEAQNAEGSDEFSRLGRTLNAMVAGLRTVAAQVRAVTENLGSATAEILAATQQQAATASEQSSAVQETNATMEEISQSGRQLSDRVREVSKAADSSAQAGSAGVKAVQESSETMEGIGEQATIVAENIVALSGKMQSIGEIITLVNDVAEQSNLLALNAAIEASEAGDQGRRFGVVASEMKSLADQSKDATRQVRAILEEIQGGINTLVMLTEEAVKRVESGRAQSGIAEQTIRQLVESTDESVAAFKQVLAVTNQQQLGVDQVAEALQNIRQATTQNAAGTDQLEKSASNLTTLSQDLRQAVERYRM